MRNLDADPGLLNAAEVGGDGDNDSDPVLFDTAEVGGDIDLDPGFLITADVGGDGASERRFCDTAEVGGEGEYESRPGLLKLPLAGEMYSSREEGGRPGFLSTSLEAFVVSDIVFGEDKLRTIVLGLAGRRGGDE